MTKYHVNPDTGAVNTCTAKIACKFKNDRGEEPKHFENKQEAIKDAEELLKAKYDGLSSDMIDKGYKNHLYIDFNGSYTATEPFNGIKPYLFDSRNINTREDINHQYIRVGDMVEFHEYVPATDFYDDDGYGSDDEEKVVSPPVKVKKFLSGNKLLVGNKNFEKEIYAGESYKIHVMSQPRSNADLNSFTGTWVSVSSNKDKEKLKNVLGDDCVAVAKKEGDKTVFVPVPNHFLKGVSELSSTIKPSKTFKCKVGGLGMKSSIL